ncbi:MAG: primosomal protein N', partial [Promicromonosporaceae bacterium]|nr:primosomal protein N' [Promicromonosporaceae bacterium]
MSNPPAINPVIAAHTGGQEVLPGLGEIGAPKSGAVRLARGLPQLATNLPVARVLLDLQPMHLDREYDYLVPQTMSDGAQPGVRVRVRFGAQEVGGFVIDRLAASEHSGRM